MNEMTTHIEMNETDERKIDFLIKEEKINKKS